MGDLAPIPMRRELTLAAPPERLWPLVANTDRFNRALGLPVMQVSERGPGEFGKQVKASLYGMGLSWHEAPFEWAEGRFFRVVRIFDKGPIARFEGGMRLARDGSGTRLTVESDFTPRNALGTFLIKHATGKRALEDAEAMLRRFDSCARTGEGEPFPTRRTKTPVHAGALAQKTQALHEAAGLDREAAARLLHLLEHGYDDELSGMRPFELADKWSLDRLAVLRVFLYATRAGMLDMSWDVLCPNCAGANMRPGTLGDLKKTAHCGSCEVDYEVDFDEAVELRFTVSPTIRAVEAHTFCVGSPARTPFAVAQLIVRPGEPRELTVDLAAESYVIRALDCKKKAVLRPSESGPSTVDLDLMKCGGELAFKPGAVTLRLSPREDLNLVRVERESWKEKGARACTVTSIQEFRDLFSSEVLAPGVDIGVKSIALLFTDLKGSTALYEKVGDASAYAIVRDHFGYLFDIVKKRNGAVVKTIGDAVMAAFARPSDAVEAAIEMQERVGELNKALAPKPPVVLKIGVHAGPVIAINAGGALDYFGTTANVAARVQNESQGGDVVLSQSLWSDSSVQCCIQRYKCKAASFECLLKGLSTHYTLRRLVPEPHA